MYGIDLNQPIEYCYASMRYFKEGERHVTRVCPEDVLLLVHEGVLHFVEDGVSYEIFPGHYHIQKQGSVQQGIIASDSPQYLYVHFLGKWGEGNGVLPADGEFSCENMFEWMEKMDFAAHHGSPLTECIATFFQILTALYQQNRVQGLANHIADYISKNVQHALTLEELSDTFSYSKNHIINVFKDEYGVTPIQHLIHKRIERAEWLLEATADTLEVIAGKCGFSDYSHFYKAFVKAHGKTPGQWRQEKLLYPCAGK